MTKPWKQSNDKATQVAVGEIEVNGVGAMAENHLIMLSNKSRTSYQYLSLDIISTVYGTPLISKTALYTAYENLPMICAVLY